MTCTPMMIMSSATLASVRRPFSPFSSTASSSILLDISEDKLDAFDDTDVTVLQTLAEHLGVALANAHLYAQLKEALAVREQILQNVSHELRTPLTLIGGYAEFLIETLPADVPD